jgi:crotonobetainyl-CoA:carnitine CoA-transferase CaiB-like acyl-CoA transferase
MALTGDPADPPTRFGLSMVDFMTGTMLAVATLAGLAEARATGIGRDFDVSLLDAALHQTSYPALWYLNEGFVTGRAARSAHPSVTPSQTFRTADGWIFVMAQQPKFWSLLADSIGASHLKDDIRFATITARLANREQLTAILDGIFLQFPTAHWLARLGGVVPIAPVNSLDGALDNVQVASMIDTVAHPVRPGGVRVLNNPIRIAGERLPNRAAPALGADSEAVLAELGYHVDDVARMRADGVV